MNGQLLEPILGHDLRDILRVVIHIGTEQLDLTDALVFAMDHGAFQLHGDVHEKRLREMASLDDIRIEGDYEDRTGVELRSLRLLPSPLHIAAIHMVSEIIEQAEHPVGAFLADDKQELGIGINFHLDDIEAETPAALRAYVGRLVPNARAINVRQYAIADSTACALGVANQPS